MQSLSLTRMEGWAVLKAKPDNMVLAATSWPGKTLCYWKTCFSFAFLLQALTQGWKGWSSFGGLNQALGRQKAKMGKVGKSSKEIIPCVIPSNCMTLSGFSILQWLQDAGSQVPYLSRYLSGFAFQIPVTIHGISHSSVPQSVSYTRGLSPFTLPWLPVLTSL